MLDAPSIILLFLVIFMDYYFFFVLENDYMIRFHG